jgi:hypothetical protein
MTTIKSKHFTKIRKLLCWSIIRVCLGLCHKSNSRRPIFSSRWFHRLSARFSILYRCISKLVWKKCVTYLTVGVQAGHRCDPAWELQVEKKVVSYQRVSVRPQSGAVWLQLFASIVISGARTAPSFFSMVSDRCPDVNCLVLKSPHTQNMLLGIELSGRYTHHKQVKVLYYYI